MPIVAQDRAQNHVILRKASAANIRFQERPIAARIVQNALTVMVCTGSEPLQKDRRQVEAPVLNLSRISPSVRAVVKISADLCQSAARPFAEGYLILQIMSDCAAFAAQGGSPGFQAGDKVEMTLGFSPGVWKLGH